MGTITTFYDRLSGAVAREGGYFNAHLHLDRAGTLDERYLQASGHRILANSHISLHEKHHLIHSLHAGPAYDRDDLAARVRESVDALVACNTRRADTLVDVTADRVQLTALDTLRGIQRDCADALQLRLGAYSPLGFLDSEPARWDVFVEGARRADFIAALPEADEEAEYPGHIGFEEHCRRMLELSVDLGCMIHVHTDQRHHPDEAGTERLIGVIRDLGIRPVAGASPSIWVIHMVSPSTYDDDRFHRLAADMAQLNIGLICCPSAAVGMRQLRPARTPTTNSIPRVLELLAAGVRVRLASDNIADICSPSTTPDLTHEIFILSAALRFYHVDILAALACGRDLTAPELGLVRDHLKNDAQEIEAALVRQ